MPDNQTFVPSDAAAAAPGPLERVRAFVNTVDLEAQSRGEKSDRLAEWYVERGFGAEPDPSQLERLARFREALRTVLEANAGHGDQAAAWRGLQPFAEAAGYTMSITPAGAPALEPQGSGAVRAIAALLAIAYDAVWQGTWPRLKACRRQSCRWAFFDRSKNGSGAWCSMRVCGNRVKAQRRRNREKSQKLR